MNLFFEEYVDALECPDIFICGTDSDIAMIEEEVFNEH